MKPMMVIPPDQISDDDKKKLEENGVCVVIAENPGLLKFVDPLPAASSRTQIEDAAIRLSRWLFQRTTATTEVTPYNIKHKFVELLIRGTPLDENGTPEEVIQREKMWAKTEEARRIGREEARLEAAARKAKAAASDKLERDGRGR